MIHDSLIEKLAPSKPRFPVISLTLMKQGRMQAASRDALEHILTEDPEARQAYEDTRPLSLLSMPDWATRMFFEVFEARYSAMKMGNLYNPGNLNRFENGERIRKTIRFHKPPFKEANLRFDRLPTNPTFSSAMQTLDKLERQYPGQKPKRRFLNPTSALKPITIYDSDAPGKFMRDAYREAMRCLFAIALLEDRLALDDIDLPLTQKRQLISMTRDNPWDLLESKDKIFEALDATEELIQHANSNGGPWIARSQRIVIFSTLASNGFVIDDRFLRTHGFLEFNDRQKVAPAKEKDTNNRSSKSKNEDQRTKDKLSRKLDALLKKCGVVSRDPKRLLRVLHLMIKRKECTLAEFAQGVAKGERPSSCLDRLHERHKVAFDKTEVNDSATGDNGGRSGQTRGQGAVVVFFQNKTDAFKRIDALSSDEKAKVLGVLRKFRSEDGIQFLDNKQERMTIERHGKNIKVNKIRVSQKGDASRIYFTRERRHITIILVGKKSTQKKDIETIVQRVTRKGHRQ